MPREDNLLGAIEGLYAAAVDQAAWVPAIDRIRQLMGAAGGVVFQMDQETGRIASWHGIGVEPDGSEYARRLHAINPRAQLSLGDPPGALCWDYRIVTEDEMDRHEFYDGIHRLSGVRYFIGVRFVHDDGLMLFTSVERTRKQGHVDAQEIALYEKIAPHISNAVRLAGRLSDAERQASLFDLLSDSRGDGLVLLGKSGRVVETNPEAERILAAADGIAITDGRLRPWKAADTRHLNHLLAAAIETACQGGVASGGVLSLPRPSGDLAYLVRVVPWPVALDGNEERLAAVVFIADPEHKGRAVRADVCACFGLSAREAELAERLVAGTSLQAASQAMGISYNTARVHLRNIFNKTGVSNQGHLLRLLMSMP